MLSGGAGVVRKLEIAINIYRKMVCGLYKTINFFGIRVAVGFSRPCEFGVVGASELFFEGEKCSV
jgi:hypothetical protein